MIRDNESNGTLLSEPHYDECDPIPADGDLPFEEAVVKDVELVPDDSPPSVEEPTHEKSAVETPKITQAEAMRQALADLGLGAKNPQLADYLRTKFGIIPKNLAVLKSAAKKALFRKQAEPINQSPAQSDLPVPPTTDAAVPQEKQPTREDQKLQPTPGTEKAEPQQVPEVREHQTNGGPSRQPGRRQHRNRLVFISLDESHQGQQHEEKVEQPSATDFIFAIEEVEAVKRLADRLGAHTLLELVSILDS